MIPSTLMPESDKALLNILPWRWLFTLLRITPAKFSRLSWFKKPEASAATDCAWELASITRIIGIPSSSATLAVEPLPLSPI
ncbi:MAG: hypothetical protein CM15mP62_01390 [Rhodospirillaceae bacterium]|nr:MAG: hypothetical protein CM15mP62_01390 [Rhodospirillaceae bacterium]